MTKRDWNEVCCTTDLPLSEVWYPNNCAKKRERKRISSTSGHVIQGLVFVCEPYNQESCLSRGDKRRPEITTTTTSYHFVQVWRYNGTVELIENTCDSNSQTLHMRYPFQSTGRPIWHRNVWSFRVYTIPVQQQAWIDAGVTRAALTFCGGIMQTNVEPGEGTGVNSLPRESRV